MVPTLEALAEPQTLAVLEQEVLRRWGRATLTVAPRGSEAFLVIGLPGWLSISSTSTWTMLNRCSAWSEKPLARVVNPATREGVRPNCAGPSA